MAWFESLPLVPGAIVAIGGFVVLALVLAWLAGLVMPHQMRREHNDLAGFIFAVVGVVYAVILGFIAIGVWERFESAETRTFDEASRLAIVYRDAALFGDGASIRSSERRYVENVIHTGFAKLASGAVADPDDDRFEEFARAVTGTQPRGPREEGLYPEMVEALDAASADRDARLSEGASGLNGVMWLVVFAGGFITVAFTYLFGFQHTLMQTAMIGLLATLIGLLLFLMLSLDFPYRGSIHVGPEAFERALAVFDQLDAEPASVQTR